MRGSHLKVFWQLSQQKNKKRFKKNAGGLKAASKPSMLSLGRIHLLQFLVSASRIFPRPREKDVSLLGFLLFSSCALLFFVLFCPCFVLCWLLIRANFPSIPPNQRKGTCPVSFQRFLSREEPLGGLYRHELDEKFVLQEKDLSNMQSDNDDAGIE